MSVDPTTADLIPVSVDPTTADLIPVKRYFTILENDKGTTTSCNSHFVNNSKLCIYGSVEESEVAIKRICTNDDRYCRSDFDILELTVVKKVNCRKVFVLEDKA